MLFIHKTMVLGSVEDMGWESYFCSCWKWHWDHVFFWHFLAYFTLRDGQEEMLQPKIGVFNLFLERSEEVCGRDSITREPNKRVQMKGVWWEMKFFGWVGLLIPISGVRGSSLNTLHFKNLSYYKYCLFYIKYMSWKFGINVIESGNFL